MKKYKVKTPNENFTGYRYDLKFENGEVVAEITDSIKVEFESWGYECEELTEKKVAPVNKKKTEK
jgi:hypothetical protein